ncbi:MAG: PIN domain protein, partial [Proteobacteria bacterium]|nr:PIN domain protein [Pseudomonadota bacterium]
GEPAWEPDDVQQILAALPEETTEALVRSEESEQLRNAYLADHVVGESATADAHHVALATVGRADLIVSWNFRHIVHLDKIRAFNAVNLREGYGLLEIRSPREVV